jgi:hypothetical protein
MFTAILPPIAAVIAPILPAVKSVFSAIVPPVNIPGLHASREEGNHQGKNCELGEALHSLGEGRRSCVRRHPWLFYCHRLGC